jgi:hypothetical protein
LSEKPIKQEQTNKQKRAKMLVNKIDIEPTLDKIKKQSGYFGSAFIPCKTVRTSVDFSTTQAAAALLTSDNTIQTRQSREKYDGA